MIIMKKIRFVVTTIFLGFVIPALVSCEDETLAPSKVSFLVAEFSVPESGGKTYTFGLELDAPTSSDLALTLTAAGTATAGTDYQLTETSVTILAGERNGVFKVKIIDDTELDGNETIIVSASANGITGEGAYTITIEADKCEFIRTSFLGLYDVNEPGYGHYDVTFTPDPANANTIISNNFWDYGGVVKYVFNPATNAVTLPTQDVVMGGTTYVVSAGTGTASYDKCTFSFVVPYVVRLKSTNAVQDTNTHTFTNK